jgi:hypothetical protein
MLLWEPLLSEAVRRPTRVAIFCLLRHGALLGGPECVLLRGAPLLRGGCLLRHGVLHQSQTEVLRHHMLRITLFMLWFDSLPAALLVLRWQVPIDEAISNHWLRYITQHRSISHPSSMASLVLTDESNTRLGGVT